MIPANPPGRSQGWFPAPLAQMPDTADPLKEIATMLQDEKKDAPVAPESKDAAPAPEKAKKRGRPKGSKNRKAAKRGGRSASVEKAIVEAYKAGIRRFGSIMKAVKKATGQIVRFPAIAMALKSVRPAKAAAAPKKAKRGSGRPKVKRGPGRPKGAKRGPGRPKGSGRGRGRPPKAAAGASEFLILQGRKVTKAGSVADVKARLERIVAKTDSLEDVEVYERRKVKIERTVEVSL